MDKKTCENCNCQTKWCHPPKENVCAKWHRNPELWLSILPTKSGWYWLKEDGREMQIVEVSINHPHVYRSGTECFNELKEVNGEWQGPITPKGE